MDRPGNGIPRSMFTAFGGVLFAFLALTSGCAATQNHYPAARDAAMIIEHVPFYPQEDFQCGPASLASVMNYWGSSVTPQLVARSVHSTTAQGTLAIDLVLYAEGKGLRASHYPGGLDDLKRNIASGHPLIVLVDYGFSALQVNHFMVVIGYTDEGIIAHSGIHEKKFIPLKDFLRTWEKTRFWTLLIKKSNEK